MEELSAESCWPDRGNRFLHGAHSDFQRVVLLRTAARQETGGPFECDGPSDCALDRTADH